MDVSYAGPSCPGGSRKLPHPKGKWAKSSTGDYPHWGLLGKVVVSVFERSRCGDSWELFVGRGGVDTWHVIRRHRETRETDLADWKMHVLLVSSA